MKNFEKLMWFMLATLVVCLISNPVYSQTYSFTKESKPLLYLPFKAGTVVNIPQGNNGTFTHNGRYAYAYDFDKGDTQNNANNKVFGLDVMSPVNGVVVSTVYNKVDFTCTGSVCNSGWGNTVIIKPDGANYYLRLNHLKYNSVPSKFRSASKTSPVRVKQGEKVGQVGSTGISTHPHLDMSLVTDFGTSAYTTIEFDFVEGPAEQYSWLVSELEENKYILDNNARVNLGAELELVGSYTNTTAWYRHDLEVVTSYSYDFSKVYYDGSTLHGENFLYNFQYGAWYAWQFKMLTAGYGSMVIEANCYRSKTQMSPQVKYYLDSPYGFDNVLVNQAENNNNTYPMDYTPLFYESYAPGTYNTVYVQNLDQNGRAMCIDSLVVELR